MHFSQSDWEQVRNNFLILAYEDCIHQRGNQMINYWNEDCEELDD